MGSRSAADKLRDAGPLFAALGDQTRLTIVARLCEEGPQSIVRLTEATRVTRQAVRKHLAALESAGLVRSTRVGRERIWELEPKRFDEAQHHLETISAQWDAAIERLRRLVEP